jgi:hypothetical protein
VPPAALLGPCARELDDSQHHGPLRKSLVVRDANGQALACLYTRENPNDAHMAKMLTEDQARRTASNIAKLPVLLGKEG